MMKEVAMELTKGSIPEVSEGGKIGANVAIILQSQKIDS